MKRHRTHITCRNGQSSCFYSQQPSACSPVLSSISSTPCPAVTLHSIRNLRVAPSVRLRRNQPAHRWQRLSSLLLQPLLPDGCGAHLHCLCVHFSSRLLCHLPLLVDPQARECQISFSAVRRLWNCDGDSTVPYSYQLADL